MSWNETSIKLDSARHRTWVQKLVVECVTAELLSRPLYIMDAGKNRMCAVMTCNDIKRFKSELHSLWKDDYWGKKETNRNEKIG